MRNILQRRADHDKSKSLAKGWGKIGNGINCANVFSVPDVSTKAAGKAAKRNEKKAELNILSHQKPSRHIVSGRFLVFIANVYTSMAVNALRSPLITEWPYMKDDTSCRAIILVVGSAMAQGYEMRRRMGQKQLESAVLNQ